MSADLVAAIDIGATKTLLSVRAASELAGGWGLSGATRRTDSRVDPERLADWVEVQVRAVSLASGGHIAAIGVAAPGPVDAASGELTRPFNLGWQEVPFASMLADRLDVPVTLEDDANAAALGEWRFGAGEGTDPFAYLTVSSGIGGGIVAGGELVRGVGGNAGEIGHLGVDPRGPRCACGHRGDVESYAGGNALARRARRAWPRARLEDGRRAPRTAEEVFRAARAGDERARALVDDAARALASALAAICAVVEPEVIAVGGSIGLGQRRLVRRAATLARSLVMPENAATLRVVPAALGQESVLAGAAGLALGRLTRP